MSPTSRLALLVALAAASGARAAAGRGLVALALVGIDGRAAG